MRLPVKGDGMYLGIEIGGTKLQLAVGDGAGSEPVELVRCAVDIAEGARGILAQIKTAGRRLIASHDIRAIGVGFGGPFDANSGFTVKSHQVAGWDRFPLVRWCQDELERPARIGNDCDCAALAEAIDGAGQGHETVFYVTVGTGIGGGLVQRGQLFGAGRPAIAEIGHLRPGPDQLSADQTVESLASGPGILANALLRLEKLRQSQDVQKSQQARQLQAECGELSVPALAKAASAGSGPVRELARELIDDGIRVLGWAVAQVITLIAPHVVVVGGGVSLMGEELFYQPLRRHVSNYVFPPLDGACRIVAPRFGEIVVVQGALRLAASQ